MTDDTQKKTEESKYGREPNPVQGFFGPESAVREIVSKSRMGLDEGEEIPFEKSLKDKARAEISDIRKIVDIFNRTLLSFVKNSLYGAEDTRVIQLSDGTLYGKEANITSTWGFDLGEDPYKQFGEYDSGIIDSRMTDDITKKFLCEKKLRNKLLDQGFTRFEIKASRFFNVRECDLEQFRSDGEIDMQKLVPRIAYIESHLGTEPVRRYDFKEYFSMMVRCFSSRQKVDIRKKLLEKLSLEEMLTEKDIISDWLAYRIIGEDTDYVEKIKKIISEKNTGLGEHIKKIISSNDYFKDEKKNGYKAQHYRVIGAFNERDNKGETNVKECLLELQIVDFLNYYLNEISTESPQSRHKYVLEKRKQQDKLGPERKELIRYYDYILYEIFGPNVAMLNIADKVFEHQEPIITPYSH